MPNLEFRCIIRTTQLQSHNCLKRFGLKGSWKELHDESQSVHHPVFMDTEGVSQQRFRTLLWSLLIFRFAWALSSSQGSLGGFSSPQQINRLGQQISQDFYTLGWAYEFSCFFSVDITVICGRLPYATL